MPSSLDDLYELFYTTTYGCNRRLEEAVKSILRDNKNDDYFVFHEYFFHQPLTRSGNFNDNGYLLAPFAIRMIENSLVVPSVDTTSYEIKYKFRDKTFSLKNKIKILNKHSWLTRDCFNHWKQNKWDEQTENEKRYNLVYSTRIDSNDDNNLRIGIFNNFTPEIFKKVANATCKHTLTKFSRKLHWGLMQMLFPGDIEKKKIASIIVPIASNHFFYGCIWFEFSKELPEKGSNPDDKLLKIIGTKILEFTEKIYVPTLAILHNHFCESVTKEALETISKGTGASFPEVFKLAVHGDGDEINYSNVFVRSNNLQGKSSEPIEKGFMELWKKRKALFQKEGEESINILLEGLIFVKYTVCSESMINLTRKVIEDAELIRPDKKVLPSALVIGGAGSGKDTFSNMLRLFSSNFFAGTSYTINMASLKPAPLVASMITGAEFIFDGINDIKLNGILQKVRKENIEKIKKNTVESDNYCKYPTLILDELNSMDIDSQGVLLRFLENAEIIPMGAIKDSIAQDKGATNNSDSQKLLNCCLVIGVMNEDPDALSKEKSMDFIRNESYFGGFLGDLLYEHFTKIRRLRPDIKYRMVRNGKYKLPLLRERKDDIPLLFYVFCKEELKSLRNPKNSNNTYTVHVTLEAFDYLMKANLTWSGNVRELQALSKRVISIVKNETEDDSGKGTTYIIVLRRHILQAIDDLELIKGTPYI